jgi:hypothetical protein
MIARVGRYVWSFKTVFNAPEAQLSLMNFVYSTTPVNTAAEKKYQEWYAENNPIVIGENETVSQRGKAELRQGQSQIISA